MLGSAGSWRERANDAVREELSSREAAAAEADTNPAIEMRTPPQELGIESHVLLARARRSLLGTDSHQPLRIGRYEVLEQIGAGGMGIVYAARDPDLDRRVAIKVLRSTLDPGVKGRSRLVREAQALAKLSHPNVVVVYEVGRHAQQVFVSMEYVEGRTLRQWLRDERPSTDEVLRMFVEAGRGLLAAHEAGVVHRDFKPDNVIVGSDGRPRVMDFGLARPSFDVAEAMPSQESGSADDWEVPTDENLVGVAMTATGTVVGTPAYMDPEQLLGSAADRFSDQYSYCVSLFEALYGKRPYRGSSTTELVRHMGTRVPAKVDTRGRGVPRAVHKAVMRGLAFERAQRHPSFAELLALLDKATVRKRRRGLPWLAGVAALGVAAASFSARRTETASGETVSDPQPEHPWAAIVSATDLPDEIPEPLPGDPIGLTVRRLTNGLTLYVVPRADQPKVSVRFVVRAGPDDEPDTAAGVAGLTRDMLLAGGPRMGVLDAESEAPLLRRQHEALLAIPDADSDEERSELAREADEAFRLSVPLLAPGDEGWLAGQFGATMRMEEWDASTQWWSDVPSSRLEAWMTMQAELIRNPSFRGMTATAAQWLDTQRWIYQGSAPSLAMGRLVATAYGKGRDPAAEFASVSQLPLAEVMQFHRTYYRPNNMALVLVGDVNPERAFRVVQEAFGDWEPAQIPDSPLLRDEPWGAERPFAEVEAPAPPSAWVGWSLPPHNDGTRSQIEAFASLLSGSNGLANQQLADSELVTDVDVELTDRGLLLIASPRDGVTLQQAEQALSDLMQRIADGAIDPKAWSRALERLPLDASQWSRSVEELARTVAQSYVHHRSWTDVASSLRPVAPSRAEVSQLASVLIARGQATMFVRSGPPWSPGEQVLPFRPFTSPVQNEKHSAFTGFLAELPAIDAEPRFLSQGMHFERHRWGGADVVCTTHDGPLFFVQVRYPMGLWHDPFVCDAVRARMSRWAEDVDVFAGADVSLQCGVEETSFRVVGVTEDFAKVWEETWTRLAEVQLSDEDVEEHARNELRWRAEARHAPDLLQEALGTYASLGSRSLDRNLPSDRQLQHITAARLRRSLETLTSMTPDVLYAGRDSDRILGLLPPALASRSQPPLQALPEPADPTPVVYVLDMPEMDQADGRVYVDWPTDVENVEVLSNLYILHPPPAESVAAREQAVIYSPQATLDQSPGPGSEFGWAYSASPDAVVDLLASALEDVRRGPRARDFASAQDDLEGQYRIDRISGIEVAEFARSWTGDIDPRLRRWMQLRRIDSAQFSRFASSVASRPPTLTLVADRSKVDMEALRKIGRVVEVRAEQVLRDVQLTDSGWAID